MNKLFLGSAALVALAIWHPAFAADMPVKVPPPAPAAIAPSWSGFYLGGNVGAAWQSAPTWNFFDPNGVLAPAGITAGTTLSAIGGLQGGYNWQFAPKWVLGVEGDFSWTSLHDNRTLAQVFFAGGGLDGGASAPMHVNTDWLSSVRGRFGYTGWNNTLLYVTGGAAWAGVKYNFHGQQLAGGAFPGDVADFVTSTTKAGWVLGGGVEWMATPNILFRAEDLYYNIDAGITGSGLIHPPVAAFPLPVGVNWPNYNVQVARVAASYKF